MQDVSYITSIERLDNKKSVVTIDEEIKFSVYRSEIKKFGLCEGEPFTMKQQQMIFKDLLPARARQRVLYMLSDSDKSEADIREKLLEAYYPSDIVEDVISYMKNLKYIDDRRYTNQYILNRRKGKSLNRIRQELRYHGISASMIEECFLEIEEEHELLEYQSALIQKEFLKKRYDFSQENPELKNKIIASLLRKGFQMEDILKVYRDMKDDL